MLERDILEAAWLLIDDSSRWTQSASARDQQGAKVSPDDSEACCWCAIGAVEKVIADRQADETLLCDIVQQLCDSAKAVYGTQFLNVINDRRDHEAIRRIYDHAIANCRLVEAAGIDDEPAETEQLRTAIGFCLRYINQLEQSLKAAGTKSSELDPVINHIKHSMGVSRFGCTAAMPVTRTAH